MLSTLRNGFSSNPLEIDSHWIASIEILKWPYFQLFSLLVFYNTTLVAFRATAKIDIHCLKIDFWKVVLPHVFFSPLWWVFWVLTNDWQQFPTTASLQVFTEVWQSAEIKTEKERFIVHKNAFLVSLDRRRVYSMRMQFPMFVICCVSSFPR